MLICKAHQEHLWLQQREGSLGASYWGFAISWAKEIPSPSAESDTLKLLDLPISFI